MDKKQSIAIALILAVGLGVGALILQSKPEKPAHDEHGHEEASSHRDEEHHDAGSEAEHEDSDEHADAEHHDQPSEAGPHGGLLLTQGDISLELLVPEDEEGRSPITIYLLKNGKPLMEFHPNVQMTIRRPSGEVFAVPFRATEEAFVSDSGISEPHFFDAEILVQLNGANTTFAFSRQEGTVELTEAQISTAGIELVKSQSGPMSTYQTFPGEVSFDEDRTAHVVPRASGVVEEVQVSLGQSVKKGQLLAVIASQQVSELRSEVAAAQRRVELARITFARERQLWEEQISAEQDYLQARQALQEAEIALNNARQKLEALSSSSVLSSGNRLELRAPFDGVVVEKHLVLGEVVSEASNAFTLSDLSRVWTTFSVSPKDLNKVQIGKPVKVSTPDLDAEVVGTVAYVGNLLGEQTRTATARVTLENPQGSWRPGLFVTVQVASEAHQAKVAVPVQAIQTIEDRPAVFVRVEDGFVAQPVTLGTREGDRVEITQGLAEGVEIAAVGSFILKSELGKSSASHSH